MRAVKRTELLLIRMTKQEKESLCHQAEQKGLPVSTYVRRVCADPPDVTREEYEQDILRLVYEVNKIGVNLNQIAKKYNEYRLTGASRDVMDGINKIRSLLKQIVENTIPPEQKAR